MKLTPYLYFDGQCREAFEFYASVLGAELPILRTHGETNPGAGPDLKDRIAHARLTVDDTVLMGSDAMPGQVVKAQGTQVHLGMTDAKRAGRIFDNFAEGGVVFVPFAKTFWSEGFGMLVDRYGTPWMVDCSS